MSPLREAVGAAPMSAAFDAAVAAAPGEEVRARVSLIGREVEVRVAGRALAERVLAPLGGAAAEPTGTADLRVCLWDEEATGMPAPVPQPEPGVHLDPGEDGVVWHRDSGGLTVIDRGQARIAGHRRRASRLPEERGLFVLLPLWYIDNGVSLVHAGLVADGDRGALLAGPGGSGKSTTALACCAAGFDYLGDDHVGIAETAAGFEGHALRATARIDPAVLAAHPFLACGGVASPGDDGKTVLALAERRRRSRTPITVVLLPRRSSAQTGLSPAPAGAALRALAPTSLVGLIGGGRWGMGRLAALLRSTPAFWLDLAGGPEAAAEHVRAALAQAG